MKTHKAENSPCGELSCTVCNTMPLQQEEKLDWKVKLKALASVNMDKEGGIYIRNISDIYEIIKDEITSLTEAHKVEIERLIEEAVAEKRERIITKLEDNGYLYVRETLSPNSKRERLAPHQLESY